MCLRQNDDKVDDSENADEIASVVCGPMMPSTLLIVLLVQWTSLWIDFTWVLMYNTY